MFTLYLNNGLIGFLAFAVFRLFTDQKIEKPKIIRKTKLLIIQVQKIRNVIYRRSLRQNTSHGRKKTTQCARDRKPLRSEKRAPAKRKKYAGKHNYVPAK